jgi:transglutaminase-like putative cysteine protease
MPGQTAEGAQPMTIEGFEAFLRPGRYIDSDAEAVVAFARRGAGGATDPVARAVALFYAVRDGIVYTPYCDYRSEETYRASACALRGYGFCVAKAALLAATARAVGIPARVGFADVRNHLASARLRQLMTTDVFYYHGYADLCLGGAWVKATPAFDRGLCERFAVRPLEFDGRSDSLFHPYDVNGRRHLEYLHDRGPHTDVPVAAIRETFERHYPHLMTGAPSAAPERFHQEARPIPESRPA